MEYKFYLAFRRIQKKNGAFEHWVAYGTFEDGGSDMQFDGTVTSEADMKPIYELANSDDPKIKFDAYTEEGIRKYNNDMRDEDENSDVCVSGGEIYLATHAPISVQRLMIAKRLETAMAYLAKDVAECTQIKYDELLSIVRNFKK